MEAIDLATLLDAGKLQKGLGLEASVVPGLYHGNDGFQCRTAENGGELIQDVVRLSNGAYLFATDHSCQEAISQRQAFDDSDWVHIQFRFEGGGVEHVIDGDPIVTPERSCIISRYEMDSIIERTVDADGTFKAVCLLFQPIAFTKFLDVSRSNIPEAAGWLAEKGCCPLRSEVMPLGSAMTFAAQDILSCNLKGMNRRTFMRGKTLELLSAVITSLESATNPPGEPLLRLSPADQARLERAREIMDAELEQPQTLAQLARRVAVNRTKLAIGFKQLFGVSVQAYWRDARLAKAREMLQEPGVRVTEVAFSIGYGELSSFTRAFQRRYGILPSDCRVH